MRSGTCKWFNSSKGYGFVAPDDGGEDVFVHQSVIKADGYRTLNEGEQVEFEVSFLSSASMPVNIFEFLMFLKLGA